MDIELGAEIVNGSGWLEVRQFEITKDGVSTDLIAEASHQFAFSPSDAGQE